ncbi:MAG: CinA family protein, partial [Gammaproteobacteria bacterium]
MPDTTNPNPSTDDAALAVLAVKLAQRLLARELKLATAESCTGGWIAKCLTDIAGSSEWFER